ncbi:VOC family protein [Actinosynnema sp. NPDC020468]|uniref:VOC family protein n=1 Tax=Actinosynnema sp. NPDC020468 TaxID=3154488 RepID=UPI0033D73E83
MIGHLECVVLDCPEPRALAEFYRGVLGGVVDRPDPRWSLDGDWSTLHFEGGVLCFQRVEPYVAPAWPDPSRPPQFHLDVGVPDLAAARTAVLALGGAVLDTSRATWWVAADPANHPFCLVLSRRSNEPR